MRHRQAMGKVEAFTVLYGGNAAPEHGVVMLRTDNGSRTLARVQVSDNATLVHLMNLDRTPIGSLGAISMAADHVPEWKVG